ncbi:MAG: DUF5915 domain-containing protein [Cytophagales bacterium]
MTVQKDDELVAASIAEFKEYICTETQALSLEFEENLNESTEVDMDEFMLNVNIIKI